MPYITPEVILEAKKMDLLTYLKNYEPNELVHFGGNTYCTKTHDSLKISNGKWCWWSRGIGGRTALDYLIKVKGYSFTGAVEQIIGHTVIKPSAFISAPKQDKRLLLPDLCNYPERAKTYLLSRGIDEEIIDLCIANGSIKEDERYHNVLFIGFDKSGTARYCAVRSTVGNFKVDAAGSDKHYSFKLFAKNQNDTLHLFESAIDLLSYATILKVKKTDWQSVNLLSLAGVYQPQKDIHQSKVPMALSQYLEDYPHIRTVVFHLDNDRPGRLATQAICTVLPPLYKIFDAPPPAGKDINEYLQLRLGERILYKERSERG